MKSILNLQQRSTLMITAMVTIRILSSLRRCSGFSSNFLKSRAKNSIFGISNTFAQRYALPTTPTTKSVLFQSAATEAKTAEQEAVDVELPTNDNIQPGQTTQHRGNSEC